MKHAYCSYFDHHYLARAILMLRSLRQHDPKAVVYVLALSEMCAAILKVLALPNVRIIELDEIEGDYPELLEAKATRSTIEYYFTLTPVLPLYVLGITPAWRVTYVDADLFFYESPQSLLDATRYASIALTPHNYSSNFPARKLSGRFNTGWMSYRRCAEAFRCLLEYKEECLMWCHDRPEGAKFADQGYLNSWPSRYPKLEIVTHLGANVGIWNADNYHFRGQGDHIFVNDEPLIFYHFHGVRFISSERLYATLPSAHLPARASNGFLIDRIYNPYLHALWDETQALRERFPMLVGETETVR